LCEYAVKVQLFVAGGHPEILPVISEVFFLLLAFFIGEGHAALFAKRRVCQHIVVEFRATGDQ
jgi:hypothetical protein